ncbi:hypothetical protein [Chamaesiphon sp. GL140_3_metabinner_50]|uniref:hypothetical protein n=1 Tax=Chamaesiphon sp. GL140_3_metabinner_50 TaxID=2970812 RepID=UPI0025DB4AD3|nr:hypothetical protein [Chamaesiphon sp. GL140_3_metabinner_50]
MFDTIAQAIVQISDWFKQLRVRQLLSVVALGFILLNTSVAPDRASKATIDKLEQMVEQENPNRPKTTKEWQQQAREVKGKPGERIERIGEQSADAVKEFGKMYPDVAKRSERELEKSTGN